MKKTYMVGVKYGISREVMWDCTAIRAANPAEAREKLREFLFGVNGRYRLYEKTTDGPVLVEENDE